MLSLTAYYVQVDLIRYQLNSVIKALDVCFKSFFALDANFPGESYSVWLFIQRHFFELVLKEDVLEDRIKAVISSLKGYSSKRKKLAK